MKPTFLVRSASIVVSGQVSAAVLGVVASVLSARALGAEKFGVLALLQTGMLIAERIGTFQSWQALLKYAANYETTDLSSPTARPSDDAKLSDLLKLGVVLDGIGALAGFCLAASTVFVLTSLEVLPTYLMFWALLYSAVILSSLTGVPIFVLRRARRFSLTALHQASVAILRLLFLVAALLIFDAGLPGAILAFAGAQLFGNLMLVALAAVQVSQLGLKPFSQGSVRRARAEHQGIFSFLLSTHANATLRMAMKEADIFLVSFFAGPASSAYYKIAKQFGSLMAFAVEPITQVIYPELTRLWAKGDETLFRSYFARSLSWGILIGVCAVLLTALLGNYALTILFGDQYLRAYPAVLACVIANGIAVATFVFQPAVLAIGEAGSALRIVAACSALQLLAVFFLTPLLSELGAAIAQIIYYASWSIGVLRLLHSKRIAYKVSSGLVE